MSRKFDADFAHVVTCDYELTRLLSRRAYTMEQACKIYSEEIDCEILPEDIREGWATFQFSQAFDDGKGWIYSYDKEKPYTNSQPVWILA